MCAYVIKDKEEEAYDQVGSCDDGEHAAGDKLLQILTENRIEFRAVYVVWYYSGNKIGSSRFDCICEAAECAIKVNPYNCVTKESQEVHHDEEMSQNPEEEEVHEYTKQRDQYDQQDKKQRSREAEKSTARQQKGRGRGAFPRRGGRQLNMGGENNKRLRYSSSPDSQIFKRRANEDNMGYQRKTWGYRYDEEYPPMQPSYNSYRGRMDNNYYY